VCKFVPHVRSQTTSNHQARNLKIFLSLSPSFTLFLAPPQELVLFSKLASKKWPNLQNLQTSLEGALGAQVRFFHRTLCAMNFRPAILEQPSNGCHCDVTTLRFLCLLTSGNTPQRVPLAMAFSRGAVRGTQRPLAHANVDIHYLEGDRLEAVHSMEQVRAHRMNESAAATASRHGAEKMAPHSSQLRTGGV